MSTIDRSKPVLVTGGSGYIASWIIKYLLEDGFTVRATVRSKSDLNRISHLDTLSKEHPGKLSLFEADLLQAGSFLEAMTGCELVIHTASPFVIEGIKDAQKELVDPAVNGTKEVLETANRINTVKRVVLTSSVAAVIGDAADAQAVPNQTMTEEHWNFSSNLLHEPYAYSKTLAEREAWKIVEEQDRWDLVVINPSFVLGPSLSSRGDSTSVNFMKSMVNGAYRPGVPALTMGIVDVRDVARAHILAGITSTAKGRHLASAATLRVIGVAQILRDKYGDRFSIPKGQLPKFLVFLVGPLFGLSRSYVKRNVGFPYQIDSSYSKKDLGLTYRPIQETLVDGIEQIIASGAV